MAQQDEKNGRGRVRSKTLRGDESRRTLGETGDGPRKRPLKETGGSRAANGIDGGGKQKKPFRQKRNFGGGKRRRLKAGTVERKKKKRKS